MFSRQFFFPLQKTRPTFGTLELWHLTSWPLGPLWDVFFSFGKISEAWKKLQNARRYPRRNRRRNRRTVPRRVPRRPPRSAPFFCCGKQRHVAGEKKRYIPGVRKAFLRFWNPNCCCFFRVFLFFWLANGAANRFLIGGIRIFISFPFAHSLESLLAMRPCACSCHPKWLHQSEQWPKLWWFAVHRAFYHSVIDRDYKKPI